MMICSVSTFSCPSWGFIGNWQIFPSICRRSGLGTLLDVRHLVFQNDVAWGTFWSLVQTLKMDPKRCQYLIWPKMGSKNKRIFGEKRTLLSPLILKKQPAFSLKKTLAGGDTNDAQQPEIADFFASFLGGTRESLQKGGHHIPPVGKVPFPRQVESTTREGGTHLRPGVLVPRIWFYRFCQQAVCFKLASLKLTASLHLNMDGWNTSSIFS